VPAAERTKLIDAIATKVDAEYVFPDLAKKMADAIRAHAARGDYNAVASANLLAAKLTADLREVSHDRHLMVEYGAEGAEDEPLGLPTAEVLEAERKKEQTANYGFSIAERMQGNIGYIDFRFFAPPAIAAETANGAMAFVANCDALIIDLRKNHGGDPEMVAYLASYLFDGRTHLNDIYVRRGDELNQFWTMPSLPGQAFGGKKPVYILTSHDTFSGAEDFAYALKNLKRATIIGEVTGGGAHPTRPFKVTDHFVVAVPFARSISPITHTDWEGTGVEPDVVVPADDALKAAYRTALENILGTTTDPERKEQLKKLLAK
jgi:C-terminal processing protease CtpA/Prc